MSSQELMQNFLNGKDINEIEFHPNNFVKSGDNIQDDNIISENIKETSNEEFNISGVPETKSTDIESNKENDEHDFSSNLISVKEQDPMSMSFYEDKDEVGTEFSTNPFDLNKVQMLPDDDLDIENIEQSPAELEKNIKDEPSILKESIDIEETEKIKVSEIQQEICNMSKSPINDIDLSKSPALEVPSPSVELSSPAGPLSPKSPIPELTDLVSPDITASIKDENIIDDTSKSPAFSQHSTATPVDNVLKSPEIECNVMVHQHPDLSHSPLIDHSPVLNEVSSFSPVSHEIESHVENTMNFMTDMVSGAQNNIDHISEVLENATSDVKEIVSEIAHNIATVQENVPKETRHLTEEFSHQIDNFTTDFKEETKEQILNLENVVKEVERDTANFIGDACKFTSENVNYLSDQIKIGDVHQIKETLDNNYDQLNQVVNDNISLVLSDETQGDDFMNINKQDNLLTSPNTLVDQFINQSIEVESKIIETVNEHLQSFEAQNEIFEEEKQIVDDFSFTNKSSEFVSTEIPNLIETLSGETKDTTIEQLEQWKCVYPLKAQELVMEHPIDIKHEIITPEYPIPTVTSPYEESKGIETPPTTPAVTTTEIELKSPEPQKIVEAVEKLTEDISEVKTDIAAVAATVAVTTTAAAVAATTIKKTPTAKPKTPITSATKKSLSSKTSPTSPTKPAVPKTTNLRKTTSTTTAKLSTTSTVKSTTPPVTKTSNKAPVSYPKPPATKAPLAKPKTLPSKPTAEKKPLTNDDIKAPAKQPTPIRRPTTSTITKTTTEKVSSSKPLVPKTTTRPITAPAQTTTKTITKTTTTTLSKPRPSSLKATTTTTSTTITKVIKCLSNL